MTIRKRLFDMDGTLYSYTPELMQEIQASVGRAVIALGAPLTQEQAIKMALNSYLNNNHSSLDFEKEFGLTHTEIMMKSFEISDVALVKRDETLIRNFREVAAPHKENQVILTSSIEHWADRMVSHLTLTDCFKAVICLDHCDHALKHNSYIPFERALEILQAEPKDADLIEDSPANLENAKKMGMRTIYVHHGKPLSELPSYIDAQIFQPAEAHSIDSEPMIKTFDLS